MQVELPGIAYAMFVQILPYNKENFLYLNIPLLKGLD